MSTASPPKDDPLVISYVKLMTTIDVGNHGIDAWSITAAAVTQHHGRIRVQPTNDGLLLIYKAGNVYQEHTIYRANIADVCRVPLSSLPAPTREAWERAEKEVRR